jgi:hypothetical protein
VIQFSFSLSNDTAAIGLEHVNHKHDVKVLIVFGGFELFSPSAAQHKKLQRKFSVF